MNEYTQDIFKELQKEINIDFNIQEKKQKNFCK